MGQRLKRWESPRKPGRNTKGRGGSARQRQRRKQLQNLRQHLKSDSSHTQTSNREGDRLSGFVLGAAELGSARVADRSA
ncbi:MAG: hypothetical protein WBA43_20545 [Elainellaceae cyanobacterium]|jgi:hypothetical protein